MLEREETGGDNIAMLVAALTLNRVSGANEQETMIRRYCISSHRAGNDYANSDISNI